MGKHYSEASQRATRRLFWLGLCVLAASAALALAWRSPGAWVVLGAIGLLGLAQALWNRPQGAVAPGATEDSTGGAKPASGAKPAGAAAGVTAGSSVRSVSAPK